jgi:hypothetical protein
VALRVQEMRRPLRRGGADDDRAEPLAADGGGVAGEDAVGQGEQARAGHAVGRRFVVDGVLWRLGAGVVHVVDQLALLGDVCVNRVDLCG